MARVESIEQRSTPASAGVLLELLSADRNIAVLLLFAAAATSFLSWSGLPALTRFPAEYVIPAGDAIGRALNFLMNDVRIGATTLSDVTRGIAWALAKPVEWLTGVLTEGLYFPLANGGEIAIPALPWFTPVILLVIGAFALSGWRPALLTALTLGYTVIFGLWPSTIVTLISVLFAVAIAAATGLGLGIWGYRSRFAARVLEPFYDALQTVPTFSYLSVILLLFGFGPIAALIATVVFAMPPMARATTLGLQQVPADVKDLATINGCTKRQRLWLVELPTSRNELLIGLNQVIMLSLAMVIIASVIGAGGLGGDVLRTLKAMRMTQALQAGLAITLLAVSLDRVSSVWSTGETALPAPWPKRLALLAIAVFVVSVLLAVFAPDFGRLPDQPLVDPGRALDLAIDSFNRSAQGTIAAIRDGTIIWLLRPVREAIALLPWLPATLVVSALALLAGGGRRLALVCALLLIAVAALGLWDKAMLSFYLVAVSILAALLIGFPIGLWAGLSPRVFRVATAVTDTIQTLPTFVYLIPVVMLFGVGDFPAFLAIVLYAIAPIIRYTAAGIKQVPAQLSEAAIVSGCSPWQRITNVLLPVATPQLLLGLNQAVMLSFSMLVITSLVGSRGLEEATLVAVAKVRPGDGLVAGFGIAVLAIIVDRLLRAASGQLAVRFGAIQGDKS